MPASSVLSETEFGMYHKGTEGEEGFKITEINSSTYTLCALRAFVVNLKANKDSITKAKKARIAPLFRNWGFGYNGGGVSK